jgi:hypothetical protein
VRLRRCSRGPIRRGTYWMSEGQLQCDFYFDLLFKWPIVGKGAKFRNTWHEVLPNWNAPLSPCMKFRIESALVSVHEVSNWMHPCLRAWSFELNAPLSPCMKFRLHFATLCKRLCLFKPHPAFWWWDTKRGPWKECLICDVLSFVWPYLAKCWWQSFRERTRYRQENKCIKCGVPVPMRHHASVRHSYAVCSRTLNDNSSYSKVQPTACMQ